MARTSKARATKAPTNGSAHKSSPPSARPVDPYTLNVPDSKDPKTLHTFVQYAASVEDRANAAKKIALRALRESLPAATFSVEGKLYQIRERNGEPYVVALASPEDVIEL